MDFKRSPDVTHKQVLEQLEYKGSWLQCVSVDEDGGAGGGVGLGPPRQPEGVGGARPLYTNGTIWQMDVGIKSSGGSCLMCITITAAFTTCLLRLHFRGTAAAAGRCRLFMSPFNILKFDFFFFL